MAAIDFQFLQGPQPTQTPRPRPTQNVQQNSLDLIALSVPGYHPLGSYFLGYLSQELVPDLARRFFEGKSFSLLISPDVPPLNGARHSQVSGQASYILRVGFRLLAPQLVVEMGQVQADAQLILDLA
jgi:hypothetical protein